MSQRTVGIICVVTAAMLWAIEPVVARYAYRTSNYFETITVRSIVSTFLAFTYLIMTRNLKNLRVEKVHIPKLAFIGLAGTAIADLLYYYSFTKIPILNSVLIAHMQPIFIVLFGFIIFREEKLTGGDFLFITAMIIAGILVTTRNIGNFKTLRLGTYGDLLVLISTVAWAISGIVAKKHLTGIPTGILVFYRYLIASMFLGLLSLKFGGMKFSNFYQVISGLIIFTGITLYYEGLKRLKTAITSSLELTSPLFASLLGYIFFKESITFMQFVGLILIFVALAFIRHSE
ncbi:MAG: DMT family transporter [Candidatus Marinimicrobia bacterium]|nr:DMT family transporter [Candidatus Neomarinimicrobiota bacterium]